MYYLKGGYEKHTRMRNAFALALACHILLIAVVSFDVAHAPKYNPQINITLATRPSSNAPEEARHISQANQQGSGEQAETEAVTSQNNLLPLSTPADDQPPPMQFIDSHEASAEVLATAAASPRLVKQDSTTEAQKPNPLPGISPEADRISRQLASLEAELDQQTRTYSDRPRVRRLTSVSAKQAADAAYLLDWRRRLEAVGNQYYPEASVRYGLYGDLRLLVVIRKDGSLEDIRVLQSSGYAVLDEAAIKIVRMAAPYSPFPAELAATTDKLEIIRTWQFQENQLSSD